MTAKLTALGGRRCAAMTCVTVEGTAAPPELQHQAGIQIRASAARFNTFNRHVLKFNAPLNSAAN
jgi:hypothetical protein